MQLTAMEMAQDCNQRKFGTRLWPFATCCSLPVPRARYPWGCSPREMRPSVPWDCRACPGSHAARVHRSPGLPVGAQVIGKRHEDRAFSRPPPARAASHVVALIGASILAIATQGCATAYRLLHPPVRLHRPLAVGYPNPGRFPWATAYLHEHAL